MEKSCTVSLVKYTFHLSNFNQQVAVESPIPLEEENILF